MSLDCERKLENKFTCVSVNGMSATPLVSNHTWLQSSYLNSNEATNKDENDCCCPRAVAGGRMSADSDTFDTGCRLTDTCMGSNFILPYIHSDSNTILSHSVKWICFRCLPRLNADFQCLCRRRVTITIPLMFSEVARVTEKINYCSLALSSFAHHQTFIYFGHKRNWNNQCEHTVGTPHMKGPALGIEFG